MVFLSIAAALELAAIAALAVKIYLMRRAADEIAESFAEKLATDTNTLVDISSRDRHMRALAASVNAQLSELRRQRRRYSQGDAEVRLAITNVSHDIRTPLTAICGYAELLRAEPLTPDAARYADIIAERAGHMKQLTEELFRYSIAVSGSEQLRLERVSAGDVLTECAASFYEKLKSRGIEPDIRLPDEKVYVDADRAALSRIYSNLISNAVKYSGGDLSIELTEDGRAVFSNSAPDLDEVQVGRLFDRFYTVEAARGSTGLGLSIARSLAERMGGAVNAEFAGGRLYICVAMTPSEGGV